MVSPLEARFQTKNMETTTQLNPSVIPNLVSVIAVNYHQAELTCLMIESIKKSTYLDLEIIVVDNASVTNECAIITEKHPDVILIRSAKNLGFAGGNNLGLNIAKGEYIFYLNNDTEILADTIMKLVARLRDNNTVGAVSPKIKYYFNPNLIQYAGSTKINPYTISNRHIGNKQEDLGQFDQESETHYMHGAAVMMPRSVINEIGVMPECFFLYYEELDYSETIKNNGYKIVYVPDAIVYHKESMSTGKNSVLKTYYMARNRLLYARRNIKGLQYAFFILYMAFVSIPKNTFSFLSELPKLKAYYIALIWNLSAGKLNLKPF